jgi:16S rRNA (uracil1498-N3)-methyltransferase
VSTKALVERIAGAVDAGAAALVLHESATKPLVEIPVAQADSIILVVGPEGGIGEDELETLAAAGAVAVRLGPTVLRTSTAAAVALGALGVLTPRWSFE